VSKNNKLYLFILTLLFYFIIEVRL